jgi:hypothetical protein
LAGGNGTVVLGNSITGYTDNTLYINKLTAISIPSYADDSAAGSAGLTSGDIYKTSGSGSAPLNVAGILMIKL